ncbi:MAG: XdhC family protein [Candidatus Omnitrophica bacterium]|nr:XdhC family protein [Candidatus Omnitrophota bacterium]MDE2009602.1 XdhC family protein [Candidatus Omnitrophota bacterium]MDE2214470.1 XdhC family protein [Candidatus Omnitrophota bacterium]
MSSDILYKALEASQKGKNYAFATITEATLKGTPRKTGAKMIVFEDGSTFGTIGGGRNEKAAIAECLKAIQSQKPANVTYNYFGREGESVCGGQMKVFIEPFALDEHLIICGAGHIALPLSAMAKILGFKVTVIDDRKAFANKDRFPHVDRIIVGRHAGELARVKLGSNDYVVIVTQGNEYDFECLKAVIKSSAAYIGVISSRPKKAKFFGRLKETGIEEKYLKRVRIPMGLDIGAQTPEEIAVSVAAEMIAVKNGDHIGTDKFKK